MGELRQILKDEGEKGSSRVGVGEASIYSFLQDLAKAYEKAGYDVIVLSKDRDADVLINHLNEQEGTNVKISF